jgi:hypothetical protein
MRKLVKLQTTYAKADAWQTRRFRDLRLQRNRLRLLSGVPSETYSIPVDA